MMLIGAPPHEEAKYEGDHNIFFQYRFFKSGRSLRNIRLDTPFRLFTSTDTASLGGYLHKTTTAISKNHAMTVVEDLQVRNMSKSAAGTADQPGRNVRANSGLNRSILDQGWLEFRRQLEYKQAWLGGEVLAVNPRNTSRTCPACGHVSAENRQTQARFACVECGYENNADVVGAINILARGHAVLRGEGQDTADASVGQKIAAQIACEVSGAVMPTAAGTRRSDSGVAQCHA